MAVDERVEGREPGRKELEAIWTRLVIDPPADRLVRWLAPYRFVTPNRITVLAGLLAIASAFAFTRGWLIVGGVLFQIRFLVDCMDGRLARIRGQSTVWGGALDLVIDVAGIVLNFAALGVYVVSDGAGGAAPPALLAAITATSGMYCWTLAHRKSLPGGGQHDWLASRESVSRHPVKRYVAWMARRGMVPTPYAVEVETVALTLFPLATFAAPLSLVAVGLWGATAFYVVASALNVYRIWRLASGLDKAESESR